ncbi:MAG: twin-arginine translocase subunit TatC [Pseudonocardia sp.]
MTLVEHLYELRNRLGIALVAVFVTSGIGFVWYEVDFFGWPSLGDLLIGPYCAVTEAARPSLSTDGTCILAATGVFDQFNLRVRVGITAGVVLASPIWLYQLWAFVAPGLYSRERRYAMVFVSIASVLFVSGAVLAYLVVTQGLNFLLTIGSGVQLTLLTGESYFGLIIALLLIFGVSFELPLLTVMLNLAGVISYEMLRKARRGLIFGLFVFAAIATPGGDPFSMLALSVALVVLFEFALQVVRINDRRRARQRAAAGVDSWDPDEPSPIDTTPSAIDVAPSYLEAAERSSPARAVAESARHDDAT